MTSNGRAEFPERVDLHMLIGYCIKLAGPKLCNFVGQFKFVTFLILGTKRLDVGTSPLHMCSIARSYQHIRHIGPIIP